MSDKLDFVFTPQINKDEIKIKCEVLHNSSKLFEEYMEAKESFVREISAKLLTPQDLIKNPHVKKLVEGLRESAHQGIDFGYGPYESNFVEIAQKALSEFEGE